MSEERIINLETKVSYQEDTIQELNKIVFEQQKRLEQIESAYRTLVARTKDITEETFAQQITDEKPPHY